MTKVEMALEYRSGRSYRDRWGWWLEELSCAQDCDGEHYIEMVARSGGRGIMGWVRLYKPLLEEMVKISINEGLLDAREMITRAIEKGTLSVPEILTLIAAHLQNSPATCTLDSDVARDEAPVTGNELPLRIAKAS